MKVRYTREVTEGFGGSHRETKVEELDRKTLPDKPEGTVSVEEVAESTAVHDWQDEE